MIFCIRSVSWLKWLNEIDAEVLGLIWCQFQQRHQQKQLAKSTATTTTRNKQLFPCQLHQDESYFPIMINIFSCANKISELTLMNFKIMKKNAGFSVPVFSSEFTLNSGFLFPSRSLIVKLIFAVNQLVDHCVRNNLRTPEKNSGKVCWELQNVVNLLVQLVAACVVDFFQFGALSSFIFRACFWWRFSCLFPTGVPIVLSSFPKVSQFCPKICSRTRFFLFFFSFFCTISVSVLIPPAGCLTVSLQPSFDSKKNTISHQPPQRWSIQLHYLQSLEKKNHFLFQLKQKPHFENFPFVRSNQKPLWGTTAKKLYQTGFTSSHWPSWLEKWQNNQFFSKAALNKWNKLIFF